MGTVALLIAAGAVAVAAAYTLGVALAAPCEIGRWLNTLVSTGVSVAFALAIGLLLYRYQTGENDRKRRGELRALLLVELGETARLIEESRSTINVTKVTALYNPLVFESRLKKHYPSPLVVEEAVRSGLLSTELTAKLQALGRLMHTHSIEVQEAVGSLPLVMGENPETARYGKAVQSVIGSEERVIRACREVAALIEAEGTVHSAGRIGSSTG